MGELAEAGGEPSGTPPGAADGAEPAIRAAGLSRSYGETPAVRGLDLTVERGSVFGFLGPNGAGKTTTIRLLLGLITPDRGSARVLGLDIVSRGGEVRSRCGVLLERDALYDRMSAWDNLEFFARIWGMERRERSRRIEELLGRFGLWERRDEPAGEWSRGMRQKLAVARALLHRPDCLFLDEPTSGLDPGAARSLRQHISGLAEREDATVFLCTHNLLEAEEICDRIGVLQEGRLVGAGPPDELRRRVSRPRVEIEGRGLDRSVLRRVAGRAEVVAAELEGGELRIELDGDADVAPLVALLVEAGVEVKRVEPGWGTLEDAYMALTESS